MNSINSLCFSRKWIKPAFTGTSFLIHDAWKHIPGSKSHHFTHKLRFPVQKLQKSHIGIVDFIIAADTLIISKSTQHLLVSRIGKSHFNAVVNLVSIGATAIDLTFFDNGIPQKLQQHLPHYKWV
ncbi:hypothetical protein J2X69_004176 [Algoriphagus sp. 4150]|uniref:hypothetical protein n=1 Tax=Algoriphagus sp. 4150 TaxID=2817756 RepID=UPI00285BF93F|nr:hypothetical protein [Algoriphagus sp. 4150]MDR7131811.1 hypothetical protein [Algoriphagus sp. 4150]